MWYHPVFGSYRTSDVVTMKALAEAMESSISTKTKSLTMFWDKQCLPVGEDWELGFLTCLLNCSIISLLVSPEGVKRCLEADTMSDNFLLEMDLATELYAAKKVVVVPIFLVDRTYPGGHEAFIASLQTNYPDTPAKHRFSRKNIAATLRTVAQLPGGYNIFRGDDLSHIAESIANRCQPSMYPLVVFY